MSDRELLELAAKAAGVFMLKQDWPFSDPFDPQCLETAFDPEELSITGTRVWYGSNGDVGGTEEYTWCPLTDDGDALRLAVKLRIELAWWKNGVQAGRDDLAPQAIQAFGDDPYAATRRAIVRAAAATGEAMP